MLENLAKLERALIIAFKIIMIISIVLFASTFILMIISLFVNLQCYKFIILSFLASIALTLFGVLIALLVLF